MKILTDKQYRYLVKVSWNVFRELQNAEQKIRFLEAIVEGYKRTFKGMKKEVEFYKNKYEMEVKRNEALSQNADFERGNYRRFRVLPRGYGAKLQ